VMPQRFTLHRIIALVSALCKLHNFCIDSSDTFSQGSDAAASHCLDTANLRDRSGYIGHGIVELEAVDGAEDNSLVPQELLDVGHHMEGASRSYIRRHGRQRQRPGEQLPRDLLCQHVERTGMVRPRAPPTY